MINKYDLEKIDAMLREIISKDLKVDLGSEPGYIIVTVKLGETKIHESKLSIK